MKFVIKLIIIVVLAMIIQPVAPWWTVMVIAFMVSWLLPSSGFASFFSGFIGIGALWLWKAWQITDTTESELITNIAALFGLNDPLVLLFIAAFAGGLAAGFGGLTGHTFKKLFQKKKSLYY